MQDTSVAAAIMSFLNAWIFRFGVPFYVPTDRGTQFKRELSELMGKTKNNSRTPYDQMEWLRDNTR